MMKQQRRLRDIGIEGITARWYDNNTRKSRLTEMKEYAKYRKASNQQIEDYIASIQAKRIDKLLMKLIFKYFLRNGAYTKDEFSSLISKTAFKQYDIREKGMGFYSYLAK